jgi:hypothetical protein
MTRIDDSVFGDWIQVPDLSYLFPYNLNSPGRKVYVLPGKGKALTKPHASTIGQHAGHMELISAGKPLEYFSDLRR